MANVKNKITAVLETKIQQSEVNVKVNVLCGNDADCQAVNLQVGVISSAFLRQSQRIISLRNGMTSVKSATQQADLFHHSVRTPHRPRCFAGHSCGSVLSFSR